MSDTELVQQGQMVEVQRSRPRTAAEIRQQVNLVQEVMKAVMVKDVHYGVTPGCGDKPALYKAGAEKLAMTFKLVPTFTQEDLSVEGERRYRVKCQMSTLDGDLLGDGIGECSSMEEKYQWKKAACKEEFEATPEIDRRVKWKSGKEKAYKIEQVRTNMADVSNTVLKMAKKRAYVDAILTVTGASDIFSQDIVEEDDEDAAEAAKNAVPPPQRKSGQPKAEAATASTPPSDNPLNCTVTILLVTDAKGGPKEKPWHRFDIKASNAAAYSTFDKTWGAMAQEAKEKGLPVTLTAEKGKFDSYTIKTFEIVEPKAEGPAQQEGLAPPSREEILFGELSAELSHLNTEAEVLEFAQVQGAVIDTLPEQLKKLLKQQMDLKKQKGKK